MQKKLRTKWINNFMYFCIRVVIIVENFAKITREKFLYWVILAAL